MLEIYTVSEHDEINKISNKLLEDLKNKYEDIKGDAYIGYPIYATEYEQQRLSCDLALITNYGVFLFKISNEEIIDYSNILDDLYIKIESKFKKQKFLLKQRELKFKFSVFALCLNESVTEDIDNCLFTKFSDVFNNIKETRDNNGELSDELIYNISASLQEAVNVSKKSEYNDVPEDTKAYLINKMRKEVEKFDSHQMTAISCDPTGIQRIRGMAGSGKTIIIARKAVELHTAHPDWEIVVTYSTRSLKKQLYELIKKYYQEKNDGMEPNFKKLRIMHAWGSPSSEGVYFEICKKMNIQPLNYREAKNKYPFERRPFNNICKDLVNEYSNFVRCFDCILIDEAQDFDENFIRLCFNVLDDNKRLVYAYDELQELNELSIASPEEIFGSSIKNDTPLRTCYRNQSTVIVTAHALGMGLYKDNGLVQIPSTPKVWDSIGYKSNKQIIDNEEVTLYRDKETSPDFLNVAPEELIKLQKSETLESSYIEMLEDLKKVTSIDKIKSQDIMIVDLDGKQHDSNFSLLQSIIRKNYLGIKIHLAAATTPEDFFRENSVVYSSIFRAKGNEAYYVYVINAQKCINTLTKTSDRNALFTAITRSKGWVRMIGIGPEMDMLIDEFNKIKAHNYQLYFKKYPDEKTRNEIVQNNKDISKTDSNTINKAQELISKLSSIDDVKLVMKEMLGENYQTIIDNIAKDGK